MAAQTRWSSALLGVALVGLLDPCAAWGDHLTTQNPRAETGDDVIAALRAYWKKKVFPIHSGEFDVDYFHIGEGRNKTISSQRMRAFLDQVRTVWESSADPAAIRHLSKSLPLREDIFGISWLSGKIFVRGQDVRNHFRANLIPGADPDGRNEYQASYTRGVDVHYMAGVKSAFLYQQYSSSCLKFDLSFLFCPGPDKVQLSMVPQENPTIYRLRSGEWEWDIDRRSRTVTRLRIGTDTGTFHEFWQCCFAEYQGADGNNLALPSITARIDYLEGYVANCFLFIKRAVQFNHELPDSAFRVSVPAGTSVFLMPGSSPTEKALVARGLERPVSNVARLIPQLRPFPQVPETQPILTGRSRLWLYAITALGFVVLSLGIYLFRRVLRRRKRLVSLILPLFIASTPGPAGCHSRSGVETSAVDIRLPAVNAYWLPQNTPRLDIAVGVRHHLPTPATIQVDAKSCGCLAVQVPPGVVPPEKEIRVVTPCTFRSNC